MLDHPIVDVALGLVLLCSVLSLVASVVKEWISTLLGLRAKNLRKGIQTLIGDDYATKLYGIRWSARWRRRRSFRPTSHRAPSRRRSWTCSRTGRMASPVAGKEDKAAGFVDNVSGDPVLGPALRALSSAGAKTVAGLRSEIAAWFDESMNRVSGWYRRRTQMIILAIGAVVTVSANASTVHVVRDLWQDDGLRYAVAQEAIAAASTSQSPDSLQVPDAILASFPLGWEGEDLFGRDDEVPDWTRGIWIAHLMGWFFTAAAVSLGAPFWFDLLSRVAKLRGTGGRPGGAGG